MGKIGTSPKEIYIWQISIGKDAQHHISSGNCIKVRYHNTLIKQLKCKTITPNAGEDVEQLSFIVGGNAK